MPRYSIDAKAFINIEVDAKNELAAKIMASRFLESALTMDGASIKRRNASDRSGAGIIIPQDYCATIDGDMSAELIKPD